METSPLDQAISTLIAGYFDENSPLSVSSRAGKEWSRKFQAKLSELPGCLAHMHDETVLRPWLLKGHGYRPTVNDNRYRFQFWFEFENSILQKRQMNMANVYSLVGPESVFKLLIVDDPRRLAWMLCRPTSYNVAMREMLSHGLGRWREYLDKDPFENPAKPNMKLMEMQFKMWQAIDMRLNGAYTQKIQNLNLNASLEGEEARKLIENGDMASIQQRIFELKARKAKAEGRDLPAPELSVGEEGEARAPTPITVEVIKDDRQEIPHRHKRLPRNEDGDGQPPHGE